MIKKIYTCNLCKKETDYAMEEYDLPRINYMYAHSGKTNEVMAKWEMGTYKEKSHLCEECAYVVAHALELICKGVN